MIRTRMLMPAMTAAAFAAAASLPLATVNDPGRPPVGTVQPNGNAGSELAGNPLDNAREAGGTLYGYRV